MKHLFRLIAVTLGLPFLALPLFAQQNRVVDPNNPPVVAQGATNVPLSLDTFGRLLVNSGNPTGSAPYRIGQTNVTLSLDGRGRVLTNDVGGGGGGSGTVTSFSAGNLSPLFTTKRRRRRDGRANWLDAAAMRSKLFVRLCARDRPASVNSTPRPVRSNSGVRNSSSSERTCRLMAACVTFSSPAAREKLESRAAASNAFKALRGGSLRTMPDVTKTNRSCKAMPFV